LENTTEGDNMRLFKLIILLFILLLFIGTTSASELIDSCTIINSSGEYKLTTDLNSYDSTCIIISSDDVIVDGAGHTIKGNPDYYYLDLTGVKVNDRYNVTVKNLKLTDMDFGIHYYNVSDGFIFNNDVSYISDTGILIDSSDYTTLTNNFASNNYYAISLWNSFNSILENNSASNSNWWGFALYGSDSNILEDNIALDNLCGIYLESSNNNSLIGNIANSNHFSGILLTTLVLDNYNWDFYSNVSSINSDWGFAFYGSNYNTLVDNIALDNHCGIRLESSYHNYLIGNIANSNNFSGIHLTTSQSNMFEDNTVLDNSYWDFYSDANSTNNDVINLNIGPTISFTSKDVSIKGSSSPANDPPGYRNINKYINATGNSQESWLFMNVSYSDIDVEDVDENTLLMWKYNDVWSQVSGTNGVNTEQNYVFADIRSFSIFAPMADLPPANIANLQNITYAQNYINWTWTDPTDTDFAMVMVYLDMVWVDNVYKGVQYYNTTNLIPETTYTISTQTVDSEGNINQTFVSHTSTTAPHPDTEPPASVTNLKNVSYTQDYINWTWTDPNNLDFDRVMIYIDQVFKKNVSKGINYYQATGLTPETTYAISTQTVDSEGNINQTFVSHTSTTAPTGPIIITIISPLNKSINTTGYVNVTAIFNRQVNATLNWNGVNEFMEGSGTSFYKNKTELLSGEFSFRIYASDSNSTSMSETRIVTVNRTEKELLYIDSETGKVNQTFEKVAPSRNVTLRIYNGTDVSGCIVTSNWIFVNSWAQLNSTLVENLNATDKLLGENFSVEPDCYYFNPDAQIQFNYTDEQLEAKGITSEYAFVKVFNTTSNKWEVPEFKRDTDLNHIIVNISHFSFYCLVGETPTIRPSSSSGGGGGSGGSGGSGGGTSREAFENILISETIREKVFKGSKVSYKFNKEGNIVRHINFTGLKNSGEIAIKVEILKNTSTLVENNLPQDVVYLNLNIWVGNLDWASSDNIANPKINFEVNKSWVLENRINVSTIRLFRYSDGNWNPLITTKIGEDDNNLILEVETPEFSPFAVCGKTLAKAGGLGPDEDEDEKITTSKESPDMTATTKKPIPGFKSSVGLVLLLILIQILRKKKL
jgi:PGF-pre-PGF domain-containing protein